jgi:hypothetical protein
MATGDVAGSGLFATLSVQAARVNDGDLGSNTNPADLGGNPWLDHEAEGNTLSKSRSAYWLIKRSACNKHDKIVA